MTRFARYILGPALTLLVGTYVSAQEPEPAPPPAEDTSAGAAAAAEHTGREELSVAEIERRIALPEMARLGRESDEQGSQPRDVFADLDLRNKYLGSKPRFIYFPVGNDPMIIPWIRDAVIAKEMLADAEKLAQSSSKEDTKKALVLAESVVARFPASSEASKARPLIEDLKLRLAPKPEKPIDDTPTERSVEKPALPPDVRDHTVGVLVDETNPADSTALVFNGILRVGDSVPKYPSIKVKKIAPGLVVYTYMGYEYPISVEGRGTSPSSK